MAVHPRRVTLVVALGVAVAVAAGWRPAGYLIVWAAATVGISIVAARLANRSIARHRRYVDVTGLSPVQVRELEAHIRGLLPSPDLTYMAPEHGWTCFHCGETFRTPGAARLHFGETPVAAARMPGHASDR